MHLHTPASSDYAQKGVGYFDILKKTEEKGIDIIAFTDHNTVAGYRAMMKEIEELEFLKGSGRIRQGEQEKLDEYRRLLDTILVLPGFEFTATLGFHILGIFSPRMPVRSIEHILLDLNVPPDMLDVGATEVGATADVLTAYRTIDEEGGLVIAAHANSSHGVALRGLGFGGQTKIAYTQDPHLHALEVTDLESRSKRSTARFYSGSKPEYPRRMHCIQGSDAHYLDGGDPNAKKMNVGDRVTELLLTEKSFEALKALFLGDDFARTRPSRPAAKAPYDHILAAREEGASIVLDFHESISRKGGKLHAIIRDVCAFANTSGGTLYVGVSRNPKAKVAGLENVDEAINVLRSEIEKKITPPLDVQIDKQQSQGVPVVRIVVPDGREAPYAIDQTLICVREETDTSVAVRDEIVALVLKSSRTALPAQEPEREEKPPEKEESAAAEAAVAVEEEEEEYLPEGEITPPKTGVEIVDVETRRGTPYYKVRDLRNGNIVHNVTRKSARKLWQYAIIQYEDNPPDPVQVRWHGEIGLWHSYFKRGKDRYDLVQRDYDGVLHVYYGVTEDGIHGEWRYLLEEEEGG